MLRASSSTLAAVIALAFLPLATSQNDGIFDVCPVDDACGSDLFILPRFALIRGDDSCVEPMCTPFAFFFQWMGYDCQSDLPTCVVDCSTVDCDNLPLTVGGTASGSNGSGEIIAFDGGTDIGSKWFVNSPSGSLDFTFDSPQTIHNYALVTANDSPSRDPMDWTLEGSNDGTTFVELDSQTGFDLGDARESRTYFPLAATAMYSVFRLDITANSGDGTLQLAELELLAPSA